ncbi:glucose-6-phosphate 1-dehydrogenase [Ordospora colligata]|uniref:Glucose-6-phosphate 1-dehydrogenase n=1 Tax=Ordospora colligata OC4 TaxID=1354746 RepID=A0A0B2UIW6_9MICR|nr:glucose-6-phosphate 1-dehydrogenase [Ordospora colligata OC4]KHN69248.1 glucose-6-phosphate 1-dehydrogenase [Ordospora colligata OC4]TBU14526.1 glucose-6-phosphate 1-dehydrogenase [Ordospora colligata]TBU14703.1 glucose-6-phosphate 1-dehydrogenase [Ordospora colligata]TBU18088.1 glucose-6-phosphate 1-dehydrogenase [Ordospora colligata]
MKILIFGSSGDLAMRKLFPALSKIDLDGVEIIGYARTKYDTEFSDVLQEVGNYTPEFISKVTYIRGAYSNLSKLKDVVDSETIVYFSVPPSVYTVLLAEISKLEYKMAAVEKPYGEDIRCFQMMEEFDLSRTVFIDHYLLKPMVVSAPRIICEYGIRKVLDNKHVKSVEIVSKEAIGGEGRHYFDKNGIIKDIMQNHMAELLAIVASDNECTHAGASRAAEICARMDVFAACTINTEKCVYGQYEDYNKELHNESTTETFCMLPVYINKPRWSGIPFIMIAGKGMNEKRTEISFEFKKDAYQKCMSLISLQDQSTYKTIHVNQISQIKLIFNVYPRCEVFLKVDVGEHVFEYVICNKKSVEEIMQQNYGAYNDHEIVFDCLVRNKEFSNVSSNEADLLWKLFDPVLSISKGPMLFYYSKGIDIPIEAEEMIKKIKKE